MNEKEQTMVCLAAAVAANCIPCFEHYYKKAAAVGLGNDEVLEIAQTAAKVKKGAHLALWERVDATLTRESTGEATCCSSEPSCCG